MPVISKHARERMKSRSISTAEVMEVIQHPDQKIEEACITIFQK